jgi:hypothetical protein
MAIGLFLPWTRHYLLRRVARHFDLHVHTRVHAGAPRPAAREDVIEGEYSVIEPDAPAIERHDGRTKP